MAFKYISVVILLLLSYWFWDLCIFELTFLNVLHKKM